MVDTNRLSGGDEEIAAIQAERDALLLQVDELRKLVKEYGHHDSGCGAHPNQRRTSCEGRCDCGWAEIKERFIDKPKLPTKNVEFFVEPCPKDWDGSPKGCWDPHPLTREICQLKPDGHKTHKRDDTTGKQLLCWVRS